jgi:hypothetical protein
MDERKLVDGHRQMMAMSWSRFMVMIGTSTFVMFVLMYQLIYSVDHAMLTWHS